jgi:predicted  nucleic acid-binding Zn-ribbon protein
VSLIIKISQNGSSQEYLFNKLGPIIIGSDKRCDLHIDDPHLEPKVLEVKVSGGNIFIKEVGARAQIYLDSVILPYREETRYREGDVITLKDTHYQIAIQKVNSTEAIEPPPFFEGEFKERLDRMNFKIREKESELKHLDEKEEKKKSQLVDLEDKYHRNANEKSRLEVEVNSLKTQKETLSHDVRKTVEKNQDTEDKIIQLKDFVKRLEAEERTLKETIVAQNLVLATLKDEREKKSKDVDGQRILLANLELDTMKAEQELKNIREEFDGQEKDIINESAKVERILNSSKEAMKEGVKIQNHIAQALKEKTLLDHEVKDLQDTVTKLENQRKDSQNKLLDLKNELDHEASNALKLREEIQRQQEEESNLKLMNGELRAELLKVEEKLSSKKNQLNQIDYQNQDITRKLSTINFELERSSLRLKDLTSEEKAQELKVLALRDEFNNFAKKSGDDKKALNKSMDEEKSKLQMELDNLRREIEDEKKNLAQTESRKNVTEVALEEIHIKQRQLHKEKSSLENEVVELKANRNQIEAQITELKNETTKFQHDKDRAQRDLSSLKLKLLECETQIKESLEEAQVEMENYKREERSKLLAEKEVYLAEVEAFRQKSLIEVENEYRRKEDDVHQKKQLALKESDDIIREARRTETMITEEANKRLRAATIDAQEREITAHNRIKEAQEYFKEKEKEADAIIQRSRLESRELMKKTEFELQDDLVKRKAKIKKFLSMKQEMGLTHIQQMTDQHMIRMRKNEERANEKLEDLKRKELKKVARLREDELTKHAEMKETVMNELKVHREKMLREVHEQRDREMGELTNKKKTMLEHINETKFRSQKGWEEEQKREREAFERTKKDRIINATQAVMNVFISETGSQGEKEQALKQKIQMTLQMAIDGQNAAAMKEVDQILDFNPTNRKKVLPVMKKYAIRFGIPAAVAAIVLADMGGIRTLVVDATKNMIKSQQSASEVYVTKQKTEWKEKHTYNPEQTVGYKNSYVENVIFTKDFDKVMENEEFQNDWILKVHDFMVKDLELSEDIAINFISAEGTLVKDLANARKDLHPQFLDAGLKKMNDLETAQLGWLKEKIPDAEKMAKFKDFQKEYFDKFYAEKFSATRELATEKKQP